MIKKIRNYVDKLFDEYPKTKKSIELKEELIANLTEKYNDLLVQGKDEDDAYNLVIASIGDISELMGDVNGENAVGMIIDQRERKARAKFIALAVVLYILSIIPILISDLLLAAPELGVVMMFVMVAVATGLLVYVGVSKPKYIKESDTLVEEFKEWKANKKQKKAIQEAIMSAFWMFVVAIYLIISFLFQIWAYSWIIFIIGAAISQVIKAVFQIRGE